MCAKVGNWYIYILQTLLTNWLAKQGAVLKMKQMIIQHPPLQEMIQCSLTPTIDWGCIQRHITITRSMDSPGREFLDFLDQASGCHVGMARSSWLHRCGMGCHRHWFWGILLNSWCGRNSLSLVHLGCWCCRCSDCGQHVLCRWGQCRLCCWEAVSSQSLSTWNSFDCFDTAFMKVSLHAAVCGTIAGAYLIAVLM